MNRFKKILAVMTVIGILAAAGAVYAATAKTPAEIAAELTGKTVDELNQDRVAGKTYGTIANDAGKLEEFKALMLEQKKAILDERVKEGRLTQAQADEILKTIKDNIATCDGTGNAAMGKRGGAGFGQGQGMGRGMGQGMGQGRGACGGGACIR